MEEFLKMMEFEWDTWNQEKNWITHGISVSECEEVFFNNPFLIFPDHKHSNTEERYYVLGKTNQGRFIFLVFTKRAQKIRVISARDMNKKEKNYYYEYEKNSII